MVGADLTSVAADARENAGYPVALAGGEAASGLADMLHQYLSQNVADSPGKESQARGLRGEVLFRAAEDEEVAVRIVFGGGRIDLIDAGGQQVPGVPAMTADFISVAHLTTGEAGPFGLLLRRKMRVRFSPGQVPFLVGVLRFMQIPAELMEERPGAAWKWYAAAGAALAAAGGATWWLYWAG